MATLVLAGRTWVGPAVILAAAMAIALIWSYFRRPGSFGVRLCASLLKFLGIAVLLICLIEPLFSGTRPRPGANVFVVLTDDSQSLNIHDPESDRSRADIVRGLFAKDAAWLARLSQQFDVRRYRFAERLRSLDNTENEPLAAEGVGTSLATALETIARRFRGRPLAGVLVVTDGNATDLPSGTANWSELPPVFPVSIGSDAPAPDVSLRNVTVTQTNFEQAPVTIRAEVAASGFDGQNLIVHLLSESGEVIDQATVAPVDEGPVDGEPANGEPVDDIRPRVVRFQLRPETVGTSFYQLRAAPESELDAFESPETSSEATLVNNTKLIVVDRPAGPYRVLYVSGRANWEFKFLRRAVADDPEVNLVGLLRIAKREPKFSFLSRDGERTNPLYRGFESQDAEVAEQYDEPVLIRLGTRDDAELRDGFPVAADVLYEYDAVILDDLEAAFFTQDQMLLLQKFVSVRGGGFLMLGGAESFFQGDYRRTPIGEMLPVYLDRQPPAPDDTMYRLQLSREGWLQPWVRLRETEQAEQTRLDVMPAFKTVNQVRGIKPGAIVLANLTDDQGNLAPALVAQRFGAGRSSALLIGDMWAWGLQRKENDDNDLAKAWRQMVRWLVADVPGRVQLDVRRQQGQPGGPMDLIVDARDPEYKPLDNATVDLIVTAPDGQTHHLRGETSDEQAGRYVAGYLPRAAGAYRVQTIVSAADGSAVGDAETGWTAEPGADEFRRLIPNRALLRRIAEESGGEVVEPTALEKFVANLPKREIPIVEPWVYPLWHDPLVFLFAIGCLVGEWGLRRWKGLP